MVKYTQISILILTAVLTQPSTSVKRIPSYAGPYKIVLKKFFNLTDEAAGTRQVWVTGYASSFRQGHEQYVRGRRINTISLSNDQMILINIDKRSNNQWKKNAFVLRFPNFCSDFRRHCPDAMKILLGDTNCPIPPGDKMIQNQTINLRIPEFPTFPYGNWLVNILIADKKGRSKGGVAVEAETIPRV